jgi:hypothetical protein
MLTVVILASLLLQSTCVIFPKAFADAEVTGSYSLNIYVVCLSGVNASGVENMSRVKDGVVEAAKVSVIDYMADWNYYEMNVTAHVYVVTDWVAYKLLVEFGSGVVIINAHGEVLPVPSGYSREEWVDKIAYAMLYRDVTWTHIAGYPFSKVFYQSSGIVQWGVDGFKRLMNHINRGAVECFNPIPPGSNAGLTGAAAFNVGASYGFLPSSSEIGIPLNGSYFDDYMALSLYEDGYNGISYCSAAVIKFAESDETLNFGFYVHLSWGSQTFDSHFSSIDCDAGYVVGAAAIWENVMKTASLNAIQEAEQAVNDARQSGRTKGLAEAVDTLGQAKNEAVKCDWVGGSRTVLPLAWYARIFAEQAVIPGLLDVYGLHFTVLAILGAIVVGGFAIRRRNNGHNPDKVD